jgi:RNA polymerase sigma factor (sigma-70 family)
VGVNDTRSHAVTDRAPQSVPPHASWAGKQFRSPTDPFATGLVRYAARRLARSPWLQRSDEDDLAQELAIKLCKSESYFNPATGTWETYVHVVVMRHAATLLRDASASKRRHPRMISLNVTIDVRGTPVELIHTITQRDYDRRRLCRTQSEADEATRRMDVESALTDLPPKQQQWLRRLMQDSVAAVAREIAVPVSTLRSRCRSLRPIFRDC